MKRNILVTGVSRGMGMATARLLVAEGAFVYGIYNSNEEVAKKLKTELKNLEIFQCDLADRAQIHGLIEKLKGIQFHGLVNCAGAFMPIEFDNFDVATWDKTLAINLNAPLLLVNGLRDNLVDGASIVNISSTDAMGGSITGVAYSASKAALLNLTQSLANILAPRKIRANAIAPGWIGDGMQAPPELLKEAAAYNLLGRVGKYEEIAEIVNFLLSDKSSYVNGTMIVADGGDSATSYTLRKEAGMQVKF